MSAWHHLRPGFCPFRPRVGGWGGGARGQARAALVPSPWVPWPTGSLGFRPIFARLASRRLQNLQDLFKCILHILFMRFVLCMCITSAIELLPGDPACDYSGLLACVACCVAFGLLESAWLLCVLSRLLEEGSGCQPLQAWSLGSTVSKKRVSATS